MKQSFLQLCFFNAFISHTGGFLTFLFENFVINAHTREFIIFLFLPVTFQFKIFSAKFSMRFAKLVKSITIIYLAAFMKMLRNLEVNYPKNEDSKYKKHNQTE